MAIGSSTKANIYSLRMFFEFQKFSNKDSNVGSMWVTRAFLLVWDTQNGIPGSLVPKSYC